jgi:gliding motility-associated-like protein
MKTKSLFRYAKTFATFIMVFLWAVVSVNAQCPTISNPAPPSICDASNFTFNDLNSFATDNGNGIVWYNAVTGGVPFGITQLVTEGIYYADDNSGTCGARASIIIDFQVNESGQNLDGIYCSNENPTIQTYIDDVLLSSIPPGGTVEVYIDSDLTILGTGTDAIPLGANNYFVVFVDNGGCKSQTEIGSTAIFNAPTDPTPSTPQEFCSTSNPTIANLDPGTVDSHSWYASVDVSGNPIPPALSSSTILIDGNTYYVQVNDIFCDSSAVPVTVTIDQPNDPGISASLEYCNDSLPAAAFDLFDELGGTPDTIGTWTGPLTTTNGFSGTVNISTLTTTGVYTFIYTVPSNGVCPESSANVTITVHETFTSGILSASNPAIFCEMDLPAAFDLFSLLENEDPNGLWTQGTTSADPMVTSPIDLTALTAGTYNFTYTQNVSPNPCPEESTTVQIEVLPDPNAGNAVNQIFCENDLAANSPFNLFDALDGSQDNNSGTWTNSSSSVVSSPIDITALTVLGSPYTFNYTIDNGSCSDTEAITITVEPSPESGTPIASFPEFCEGVAPASFDLFDLLDNEDQTGTWYIGNDNTGTTTSNPVDLSGLTPATYNFTFDVDAIGSCDDVLLTVSITINPLPDTGVPTSATFCENDLVTNSPLDLFGQLTGEDSGGTWTDDDTTGTLTGSNVDLTSLTIGFYNFTYSITDANGCSNSSTVIITVEDAPESGTVNTPVEFCIADITTGQTYNLFDLLTDEDQTGTWNDDDTSGALSGNLVTLDGLAAGTYDFTFDVDAIGTCDDINVTVSIIINDIPAPAAVSPQEFCNTATVAELIATGTAIQWYDVITGGTPLADTTALVNAQTYYATQTDATTGCESSVRTPVTVTIYQSPNAGNLNAITILSCNDDNNIDLFTGLDGTQDAGGTWTDDDGTGALTVNIFDATAVTSGTYSFTYTVTASAPCIDDNTTITVTIEEPLNAGTDNVLDVCSNNGTTDLFTLIGSADTGGTWSPALASGTGVFDPLVDPDGTHTYTLTNACGTYTSEVVVTVTLAPFAGTDSSTLICVIDEVTDLFPLLGTGAQSGGTWSPALTNGTGEFDPNIDTDGIYTYTVATVSPCSPDSVAQITVTVDDSSAPAVIDANPEYCLVDNPTVADLDSALSITGTVIWYEDAALTTLASSTDSLVDGEDYYATQTNSSGCESSTNVTVTVTINDTATPTEMNSNLELCINDNPILNELTLNITEYDSLLSNVIWYDAAIDGSVVSDNNLLNNGQTYYAVLFDQVTGCESSVRLAVTPDLTSCGELIFPDGFSPNGDGVNDTYDMYNLNVLYPNFEMEIYNRNGNIVYKGNANTPRFDGTSNQSRVVSKGDLPVGVYFYIFNYNNGVNKPKQGRLYLSR